MTLKTNILVVIIASTVLQVVYSIDFILDANGQQIACEWGRPEINPQKCPEDGYCYVAPDDSYAYCARWEIKLPADAIVDAGGNAVKCGPDLKCGTLDASCNNDPSYPTSYCARRP